VGQLYDIIQRHIDDQQYPTSQRQVARAIGVSPSTLKNWQEPTKLIAKDHLLAISRVTHVPYERVRDALLEDIGYLRPEPPADPPKGRKAG
jgi:DNA-binding transcriptional regulator YdaS (Cro superfamily)